jgi:hypothetical protein
MWKQKQKQGKKTIDRVLFGSKRNKNRRKTIDRVLFACPFRKQEKKKQKQENQETNTCPEKPPIEPKNRYTKQEKKMFSKFIQPYT